VTLTRALRLVLSKASRTTTSATIESPLWLSVHDSPIVLRVRLDGTHDIVCVLHLLDVKCGGFAGVARATVVHNLFRELSIRTAHRECFAPKQGFVHRSVDLPAGCVYLIVEVQATGGVVIARNYTYFRIRFHDADSRTLAASAQEMVGEEMLLRYALKSLLVEDDPVQAGLVLEFGAGASTFQIARALRSSSSTLLLHSFDSLLGLPADWKHSARGSFALGPGFLASVRTFENIIFHPGWFADSLPEAAIQGPIRFVLIDVCLESSASFVLEHLVCHFDARTTLVFANFFNMRQWKEPGEFPAWAQVAAQYGLKYSYVSWFGTWMHIQLLGPPTLGSCFNTE
jgi:hypothetical protein